MSEFKDYIAENTFSIVESESEDDEEINEGD